MLIVYAVLAVIGLILLVVGAVIVNNETIYTDQESGITLAVAGVVIANLAGALLMLAGRRVVSQRKLSVLGAVPVAAAKAVALGPASSAHLVGGEGLTHYHRADCPMAVGRDWPEIAAAEHERAGRTACGVCRP